MNVAKLTALRERYSPEPIPTCRLCGAEMSAQRISGSRITYACTGATYDDTGCHYAPGRKFVDEHYEQSQVTVVDVSDPDVIELIGALEAKDARIAELEARKIKLPSINPQMFNEDVMFGYRKAQREAVEFCAAAGINLETGGEA